MKTVLGVLVPTLLASVACKTTENVGSDGLTISARPLEISDAPQRDMMTARNRIEAKHDYVVDLAQINDLACVLAATKGGAPHLYEATGFSPEKLQEGEKFIGYQAAMLNHADRSFTAMGGLTDLPTCFQQILAVSNDKACIVDPGTMSSQTRVSYQVTDINSAKREGKSYSSFDSCFAQLLKDSAQPAKTFDLEDLSAENAKSVLEAGIELAQHDLSKIATFARFSYRGSGVVSRELFAPSFNASELQTIVLTNGRSEDAIGRISIEKIHLKLLKSPEEIRQEIMKLYAALR